MTLFPLIIDIYILIFFFTKSDLFYFKKPFYKNTDLTYFIKIIAVKAAFFEKTKRTFSHITHCLLGSDLPKYKSLFLIIKSDFNFLKNKIHQKRCMSSVFFKKKVI